MICPNCGNRVYAIYTWDTEYSDNEYFDLVEGCCNNCGKSWQWEKVYSYSHDKNIQEIRADDHL